MNWEAAQQQRQQHQQHPLMHGRRNYSRLLFQQPPPNADQPQTINNSPGPFNYLELVFCQKLGIEILQFLHFSKSLFTFFENLELSCKNRLIYLDVLSTEQ